MRGPKVKSAECVAHMHGVLNPCTTNSEQHLRELTKMHTLTLEPNRYILDCTLSAAQAAQYTVHCSGANGYSRGANYFRKCMAGKLISSDPIVSHFQRN